MMDTNSSTSHFHQQGIESNEMYKNANGESIGVEEQTYANQDNLSNQYQTFELAMPGPSQSNHSFREPTSLPFSYDFDNKQPLPSWKMETVECKQEVDNSIQFQGGVVEEVENGYNSNFGSYQNDVNQFNYHDNGNSYIDPQFIYNRDNYGGGTGNFNPYQIPASSKNQLPPWYQPPSSSSQLEQHHHYNSQQQAQPSGYYPPNYYPQHSYQGSYMGTPLSTEHNMRNMIQMTANR